MGIILSISGFSQSKMDSLLIEKKVQSSAKKINLPNGNILFDFEKDFFGKLRVDISMLSSGDTAVIYIGEKLDESGKIDRKPGGNIRFYRYMVTKNTSHRASPNPQCLILQKMAEIFSLNAAEVSIF